MPYTNVRYALARPYLLGVYTVKGTEIRFSRTDEGWKVFSYECWYSRLFMDLLVLM